MYIIIQTIINKFTNFTNKMKKYLLSFILSVAAFAPSYADGYTKDLASALPAGEYKVKLVNAGKLGKTKAMPKTITVGTDDTEKVISFK